MSRMNFGRKVYAVGANPVVARLAGINTMRIELASFAIVDLEMLRCEAANIGVVIGGAFNSGILATGPVPGAKFNYEPATPEILAKVGGIQDVCRRPDMQMVAAALQFLAFHTAVDSVIPGALKPERVAGKTAAFDAKNI